VPEQWRVLKFGGTSVVRSSQWKTIASLIEERRKDGDHVLLVCSAMAGVTNYLDSLTRPGVDQSKVSRLILEQHQALAAELNIDANALLVEAAELLETAVNDFNQTPGPERKAALISLGEWMSSKLGQLTLSTNMNVDWVDAKEALKVLDEEQSDSRRAWLSAQCESVVDTELASRWLSKAPVLITQGFVAARQDGRTAVLGRGGSDTSAALLAGRLGAKEVEIWTDVPGLFSADPARLPQALLLNELNYAEALEMAASGARVVHPRCIRAAADAGMSIQIRDISRPELAGTRITGSQTALVDKAPSQGIKAVTCQDGMLVVHLENMDSRQQVGFLAWVFGIFSKQGISVDLVATSETTTTVAINGVDNMIDDDLVQSLSEQLRDRCKVRVYKDCCCVNLVGKGARTALADLAPAVKGFGEWPLLMLSQSANDMCLSMLVHPDHAPELLSGLHNCLVENGPMVNQGDIYGLSWAELERG
jgi:diaminopimelate decarboxylase/aspartate kinase